MPENAHKLLEVDLTAGTSRTIPLDEETRRLFLGGRGLGMKLLWDRTTPGMDPLSPENPLMFMPGPFSGFPIPSSSRTCVVTKSPRTSPVKPVHDHGSTVTYTNMGGFFGPEIRFAGYEGLVITGKAEKPVYIRIEDEKVEILDASSYWGMGTDEFDRRFMQDLGDFRFETCYIGPAGEKRVPMACIINTAARAAGRGGAGCVMGSKNLKAIAVKGTGMPSLRDHPRYLELLEKIRDSFAVDSENRQRWREGGTTNALTSASERGLQAVKNYMEGSFEFVDKIGTKASREKIWKRDFACFSCALACKKSGIAKGAYGGIVHDGPEYETGTMLGANLMIDDLEGLTRCITVADDLGLDIISLGNTIGFLTEAYGLELIGKDFLGGTELRWGAVDPVLEMINKIGNKEEGIGTEAGNGVRYLAGKIGQGSSDFAIHVKGHELAAWNVNASPDWYGISYVTANRGACHMNGGTPERQNGAAVRDSLAACSFASSWYKEDVHYRHFVAAITGAEMTEEELNRCGERIFNLEKMYNYREGFRREDDVLPERFYENRFTYGPEKGAIVDKEEFRASMDKYYTERGWDVETSKPSRKKLEELELVFTVEPGG